MTGATSTADRTPIPTEPSSGQAPRTTIWDELNAWGNSLPLWQRYIVAHAVRDGRLTDDRIDEAYRLFLRDKDLDSGDKILPEVPESITGRAPNPGTPLTIKAIRSPKNVNAIPETSQLTFGPQLTVIYGHNGTGKSGFARIFSRACFSRSSQHIIRNIYDSSAADAPASANFIVDRGNALEELIPYTDGDEIDELKRISVFDSSTARVHLTKENELGFQPTGFDVFEETIRVISIITQRLDADITSRTKPNKFEQIFTDPGPVATKIAGLTANSEPAELRALAVFATAERARLEEVGRQEKELLLKSPIDTLKALSTATADVTEVTALVSALSHSLGASACDDARRLLIDHKTALLEAMKAGSMTIQNPRLTQTGSTRWDSFVLASRDLGRDESPAYPAAGDPCLLCHRPLDGPSATLIGRMWGYLDHQARATAAVIDEQLNEKVAELNALECRLLPLESRIRADLSKHDPALVGQIDTLSSTFSIRREAIVSALNQGNIDAIPAEPFAVSADFLENSLKQIATQEAALREGKFDDILSKLKEEHIALRQRQVLSRNIEDVIAFVEDLAWIKKAQGSRPTTRFVTDQQRTVFEKHIEGQYKDRLENECKALDCSLPFEFKARGSAGKTLRGLKAKGGHKPDDIFSEGEQRALSLADFLTEINLNPSSAAIVLDDPVTSMDHLRKHTIARRLVDECAERQVIIFTHDLVFFTLLSDYAEAAGRGLISHWIECNDGAPGYVTLGETPASSKIYRKTTKAKLFLENAKKETGQKRVDLVRAGAGALRRTIEEVVIFHLFKDTVRRWNEQIRLGCVSKISWSNELADEIVALQDDTSRLLEGHSNSDEFAGGMPDVDSLEKLIVRTDAMIEKAKIQRA